jgi:outer membrane protein assembly factor BamB
MTFDTRVRRPLRLWPGIALAVVLVLVTYVVPRIAPDAEIAGLPLGFLGVLGGLVCAISVFLWWVLFSRARWVERLAAPLLIILGIAVTRLFVHDSIAGAGMGMLFYISAIPGLALALVAWAAATHRLHDSARRATLVIAIALACTPWLMLRTAGIIGGAGSEFHWRWTPTPEERLLALGDDVAKPATPPPVSGPEAAPSAPRPTTADKSSETVAANASPAPAMDAGAKAPTSADETAPDAATANSTAAPSAAPRVPAAEWPGFRGPRRDGVVRGVQINANWAQSPPTELWRRPVGPGWSSFAVQGDLIYTQEQRGQEEMVSCYRLSTGEPVWRHSDSVRFWESNGGAGPRATPTLHGGRVYAFGATGILNALDARTGARVWSRNVAAETGRQVPDWGFASSPLIVDDLVVVAAAGTLAAYDAQTGEARWRGPSYGGSYSSPHLVTLDGVQQVVLLGGPGAISIDPSSGAVLWIHKWAPGPIVQPALTDDGDIIINALAPTGGMGTRRLHATRGADGWVLEERWTSNGLKPYFNDFVIHEGHAYGFDGSILAAIDLTDGVRKWKGGRYGNGQLIALADQDLLLVISEEGELALVSATPDKFTEVARFPALNAKTWNHPVIVRDVLLVRNGEEMAAFRLPLARWATEE